MSSSWRRYEVLLPTRFNDGSDVPGDWLAEAVLEIVARFGAASYETQRVEGHWRHAGVVYRDDLVKIVVDLPDSEASRDWMKDFKLRWKTRLKQIDLWLVTPSTSSSVRSGRGERGALRAGAPSSTD